MRIRMYTFGIREYVIYDLGSFVEFRVLGRRFTRYFLVLFVCIDVVF